MEWLLSVLVGTMGCDGWVRVTQSCYSGQTSSLYLRHVCKIKSTKALMLTSCVSVVAGIGMIKCKNKNKIKLFQDSKVSSE